MSKPMFDDVFSFRGRRNRKSYIHFTLAAWTFFAALTFLLVLVGTSASESVGTAVAVFWLVGLIPFAWASWAVSAQRCRDFGCTGWAALFVIVPYVGPLFSLALFFIPGTPAANRYGPNPIKPAAAVLAGLRAHHA